MPHTEPTVTTGVHYVYQCVNMATRWRQMSDFMKCTLTTSSHFHIRKEP